MKETKTTIAKPKAQQPIKPKDVGGSKGDKFKPLGSSTL
jgi:hypothetical protein